MTYEPTRSPSASSATTSTSTSTSEPSVAAAVAHLELVSLHLPGGQVAVQRELARQVLRMRVLAEVQRLQLFFAVAEHLPVGAVPPDRAATSRAPKRRGNEHRLRVE